MALLEAPRGKDDFAFAKRDFGDELRSGGANAKPLPVEYSFL